MKLVADEHIPPAFVTALRSEGYDVTAVGGAVDLGSEDETIVDYARKENRVVLSEDSDFRGADPNLDLTAHPGIFACDVNARPGEIATAVRRIDDMSADLTETVIFIPKDWV